MKIQNQAAKEKLIQRLRRVEGQVRGVEAMLEEERDCQEILQQLSAIHSAVQSASRVFLQEYASTCLQQMDEEPSQPADKDAAASRAADRRARREKIVQDMIALLDKAP